MIEPRLHILLQRRNSESNMARFYVLAIEPSLFGDAALVRAWGGIGSTGRQRPDLYPTANEAGEKLEAWLARKLCRGYVPAGTKGSAVASSADARRGRRVVGAAESSNRGREGGCDFHSVA